MSAVCKLKSLQVTPCACARALFQIDSVTTNLSDRRVDDNLTKNCVSYYCPGHLNKKSDRNACYTTKTITYLTFSPDGQELLVNMGSEQIYLYDLTNAEQPTVSCSRCVLFKRLNRTVRLNRLNWPFFGLPPPPPIELDSIWSYRGKPPTSTSPRCPPATQHRQVQHRKRPMARHTQSRPSYPSTSRR